MNTVQILFWSISLLMLVAIISVSVKVYKKQLSTQSLSLDFSNCIFTITRELIIFCLSSKIRQETSVDIVHDKLGITIYRLLCLYFFIKNPYYNDRVLISI